LAENINDYVDFTPPSINSPSNNDTYLLPFVSGNLCEILYSNSGWSDEDLNTYFTARYSLQTHIAQLSGFIRSNIPYSSGYNEIPLTIEPTNTIKQIDPFYHSLSLPVTIDYNTVNNNPSFYLNLESSSDFNFVYSGQFIYTNGYIDFLSNISSGNNIQTSIPVISSKNRNLDPYDSFSFNSKVILGSNGSPYSGQIKIHNLEVNLNTFNVELTSTNNFNMYLETIQYEDNIINFFTKGHQSLNSGVDFYTDGIYGENNSLDLYLRIEERVDNNLPFYLLNTFGKVENIDFFMSGRYMDEQASINFITEGALFDNSNFDMFISGVGSTNTSLNMFTYNSEYGLNILESGNIPVDTSSGYINNNFRMFIGGENYDNSINMFISAIGSSGTPINMFIGGENSNINNNIDFFVCNNSSGIERGLDFFTTSSETENSSLNMFIGREYEAVDYSLPMLIKSNSGSVSGIDFSLSGAYFEYNDVEMFISGSETPNKTINLFTHGF
jgi:hypothetical protein